MLLLLAPLAAATDETDPDCEAGQRDQLAWEGATLCEGEHWDGQDASGVGTGCDGTTLDPDAVAVGFAHRQCAENGQYAGDGGRSYASAERHDPRDPLGLRAGAGSRDDARAYSAANVVFVGEAVFSVCVSSCGALTLAVYAEDATPGNLLSRLLVPLRLTQDAASHGDGDHETYEQGTGYRPLAGSSPWYDNQAWTLTVLP